MFIVDFFKKKYNFDIYFILFYFLFFFFFFFLSLFVFFLFFPPFHCFQNLFDMNFKKFLWKILLGFLSFLLLSFPLPFSSDFSLLIFSLLPLLPEVDLLFLDNLCLFFDFERLLLFFRLWLDSIEIPDEDLLEEEEEEEDDEELAAFRSFFSGFGVGFSWCLGLGLVLFTAELFWNRNYWRKKNKKYFAI